MPSFRNLWKFSGSVLGKSRTLCGHTRDLQQHSADHGLHRLGQRPTGIMKSVMNLQAQATDGRNWRIGAKRWGGRVDAGIYQNREVLRSRLQKPG